ncbi:hypothetical protein BXZ70DRAFT_1081100, partial [Cristinia sonorae]
MNSLQELGTIQGTAKTLMANGALAITMVIHRRRHLCAVVPFILQRQTKSADARAVGDSDQECSVQSTLDTCRRTLIRVARQERAKALLYGGNGASRDQEGECADMKRKNILRLLMDVEKWSGSLWQKRARGAMAAIKEDTTLCGTIYYEILRLRSQKVAAMDSPASRRGVVAFDENVSREQNCGSGGETSATLLRRKRCKASIRVVTVQRMVAITVPSYAYRVCLRVTVTPLDGTL